MNQCKNKIKSIFSAFAIMLLVFISYSSAADEYASIADYIDQHANLTVFSEMLGTGDLHKTLDTEQHYTVFAFTDDVYNIIPESARNSLNESDHDSWRIRLISNHIFKGIIELPYSKFPIEITSITGSKLLLVKAKGEYLINNARVITQPVSTGNGVVMLIDAIIIP